MADEELLQKVHGLGDLDLAALLCLVSREHCLISTEPEALDDLVEELQLVASRTFGLKPAVVDCTPDTTLDDFAASIQLLSPPTPASRSNSPFRSRTSTDSYFHSHHGSSSHPALRVVSPLTPAAGGLSPSSSAAAPQIANVVLARNLDRAPKAVQIQALELLRTRRIFTRTSVVPAPKQFLFVAVVGAASGGEARVTEHLNDYLYIAHWHDPEDGFAHLEDDEDEAEADETASFESGESVVRRSAAGTPATSRAERAASTVGEGKAGLFSDGDLAALAALGSSVHIDIEVLRYQMNIISFLRMHRAVARGIEPQATKHFENLVKSLAVLHGLDYATPALVGLAAKKIYLHRIRIVAPEKERSMQWGSQLSAVEALLDGVGPEDVIEEVLGMVAAPV